MKLYIKILSAICFAFFLQVNSVDAQLKIERKIIIEKGLFYFFSINEETQLATMHTGFVYEKLSKAKKYQLPAGRELNDPLNPLSFDIIGSEMISINWILNSNNSRYEAIKKINLNDWKKNHNDWTNEQWAQLSFEQPMLVTNEPWQRMLSISNILDNCFFDIVKTGGPVMAICNQSQLWISRYNGTEWKTSAAIPVNFKQYFSLVERNGKAYIVDVTGNVFIVDESSNTLVLKNKAATTKPQILIADKDHASYFIVPAETVDASTGYDLGKIIQESGTEIIF